MASIDLFQKVLSPMEQWPTVVIRIKTKNTNHKTAFLYFPLQLYNGWISFTLYFAKTLS